MNGIQELVALSRHYGQGEDWVIAGGGNTSVKDQSTMWVKASGTTLKTIVAEQFVAMDREALNRIWEEQYPDDTELREQRALEDLMAARIDQSGSLRPSVETLMHALFPQRWVVHTHPTIVNGLSCSRGGEQAVARLFEDRALWIPTIEPGYTLAVDMRRRVQAWRDQHNGEWPQIVIMQNHGLVVAADTVEEIHRLNQDTVKRISSAIERHPQTEPEETDTDHLRSLSEMVSRAMADMQAAHGSALERPVVSAFASPELLRRAATLEAMAPVFDAFTPDHIVYAGHKPCFVNLSPEVSSPLSMQAEVLHAVHDYCDSQGVGPKIVVLRDRGAVAVTATERKTVIAHRLFVNALKIAAYAESFDGSQFMPHHQVEFVRGWEVEAFRERQSTS